MAQRKTCVSTTGPRVSRETSDPDLIAGVLRGSEPHFNLLYDRYFQRVYSFVYLRLRNRADSEEVTQEVFTAVYRSVSAYRGQSSLAAWIYGIAKNTVNNHIRRAKAHQQRLDRAELELARSPASFDVCTPAEHFDLRKCEEAIQQQLGAVADWHAKVFVMRHFEDLSIDEISRRVSRSQDAVRSSLYRMKKLLVEAVGMQPSAG